MQFKLFLVILGLNSVDPRPPMDMQTMDACKEVKVFYESIKTDGGRQLMKAYCLDDGEAPDEDDKK